MRTMPAHVHAAAGEVEMICAAPQGLFIRANPLGSGLNPVKEAEVDGGQEDHARASIPSGSGLVTCRVCRSLSVPEVRDASDASSGSPGSNPWRTFPDVAGVCEARVELHNPRMVTDSWSVVVLPSSRMSCWSQLTASLPAGDETAWVLCLRVHKVTCHLLPRRRLLCSAWLINE
ncbi:hypothetical protein GWK47_039572 [Chionoecetes opilio]|uniref:Uncharacterized protein n=1 Tax=Chionoecetes opilio TaxID=41210 RepID=A0A8J4YK19_CHIOP|nr:hypothetical protein GWK47_039572 [Chionoecetes opilio]